jgi:hypothetical protein
LSPSSFNPTHTHHSPLTPPHTHILTHLLLLSYRTVFYTYSSPLPYNRLRLPVSVPQYAKFYVKP